MTCIGHYPTRNSRPAVILWETLCGIPYTRKELNHGALHGCLSTIHSPSSGSGGPSGAGAVLMDEQQQIFSKSQSLGHVDISVAEAKALLLGLCQAIKYCDQLTVKVDHQGLVQALTEDGYQPTGEEHG